jgi:hypothetical protein
MHLDEVDVGGVRVPVIEGAFVSPVILEGEGEHEIVVSAVDAGEQRIAVRVDLAPPMIEILSPRRGAFFDASDGDLIRIEGRVTDSVTSIAAVRVNGSDVELAGDRFSFDLRAEHGVNVLEVVATDSAGHTADVVQGAIWGEYVEFGALLPDAVTIGLRADVFEAFEAQLELGLAAGLSTASVSFESIDVEIVPRSAALDLGVVIDDVSLPYTYDAVVFGAPVHVTGVISADRAEIASELHVEADTNGELTAYTEDSIATLTNFSITADGVPMWLSDFISAQLEPAIEQRLVEQLDAQDLSAFFDLSQLLPPGVDAAITSVDIEPSGMSLSADAAFASPPAPGAPDAPGVLLSRGPAIGGIPTDHMLRASISDDLLNGALFDAWRAGTLTASIAPEMIPGQITLDGGTFALFFGDQLFQYAPPETQVILKLRPLLPPVATLGEDAIELDIADLLLDLALAPDGEEPIVFATFAVALHATVQIDDEAGAISTMAQIQTQIDLADAPLFPVEEEALENLISSLLLAVQLPIQIPIQPGMIGGAELEIGGDYLSIYGDL